MNSTIFIPQVIKVGYQHRSDTYTQKLAYVIYYDETGKLRKEESWQSWRDASIPDNEYENIPMEGFVLNKKVGGYAEYHGNFRQTYVRVYDPRGFEFEISIPNLLYILEHCSSIKGKGLEGEFVYGWDGTDLVLIPTSSPDYQQLKEYNSKRFNGEKIKAKDLQIGRTYLTKRNNKLIYMGKFDYYDWGYVITDQSSEFVGRCFKSYGRLSNFAYDHGIRLAEGVTYKGIVCCVGKRHYFYTEDGRFFVEESIPGKFIGVESDEMTPNYAELFEKLEHCSYYSPEDKSKTQYVPVTLDELKEKISKSTYTVHLARYGEGYRLFEVERRANQTCALWNDNRWSGARLFENETLTPETIFNRFEFFHRDIYLANGNFSRREY